LTVLTFDKKELIIGAENRGPDPENYE